MLIQTNSVGVSAHRAEDDSYVPTDPWDKSSRGQAKQPRKPFHLELMVSCPSAVADADDMRAMF